MENNKNHDCNPDAIRFAQIWNGYGWLFTLSASDGQQCAYIGDAYIVFDESDLSSEDYIAKNGLSQALERVCDALNTSIKEMFPDEFAYCKAVLSRATLPSQSPKDALMLDDYLDYFVDNPVLHATPAEMGGFRCGEVAYDQIWHVGVIGAFGDHGAVLLNSNGWTCLDNIKKCPAETAAKVVVRWTKINKSKNN